MHWLIDWLIGWLVGWLVDEKLVVSILISICFLFSSMHIASSQQTVEEFLGNALEAIAFLRAKFPGGFENIRSLYLKLGGLSLPIYIDTGECHLFSARNLSSFFWRNSSLDSFFEEIRYWIRFLKKFLIGFVFWRNSLSDSFFEDIPHQLRIFEEIFYWIRICTVISWVSLICSSFLTESPNAVPVQKAPTTNGYAAPAQEITTVESARVKVCRDGSIKVLKQQRKKKPKKV